MAANDDIDDIYADDPVPTPLPSTTTPSVATPVTATTAAAAAASSVATPTPSSSTPSDSKRGEPATSVPTVTPAIAVAAVAAAPSNLWSCAFCTFENEPTKVICGICDQPRPATRTVTVSSSPSSSSSSSSASPAKTASSSSSSRSSVGQAAITSAASMSTALSPSSSLIVAPASAWQFTAPAGYTGATIPSVYNASNLGALLMAGQQLLRDRVLGRSSTPGSAAGSGGTPTTRGRTRRLVLMRPDGTALQLYPDEMEPNSLYQVTARRGNGEAQYICLTGHHARDLATHASMGGGESTTIELPFSDSEREAAHPSMRARVTAAANEVAAAIIAAGGTPSSTKHALVGSATSGGLQALPLVRGAAVDTVLADGRQVRVEIKTKEELKREEIEILATEVGEHDLNGGLEEFKIAIDRATIAHDAIYTALTAIIRDPTDMKQRRISFPAIFPVTTTPTDQLLAIRALLEVIGFTRTGNTHEYELGAEQKGVELLQVAVNQMAIRVKGLPRWNCTGCTYENPGRNGRCEVCGAINKAHMQLVSQLYKIEPAMFLQTSILLKQSQDDITFDPDTQSERRNDLLPMLKNVLLDPRHYHAIAIMFRGSNEMPGAISISNFAQQLMDGYKNPRVSYHMRIDMVIKLFVLALELLQPHGEMAPFYSQTYLNLGNAYRLRVKGTPLGNCDACILCYQRAISVMSPVTHPQQWALTKLNLSLFWSTRPGGKKAENKKIGDAIEAEVDKEAKTNPEVAYVKANSKTRVIGDLRQAMRGEEDDGIIMDNADAGLDDDDDDDDGDDIDITGLQ